MTVKIKNKKNRRKSAKVCLKFAFVAVVLAAVVLFGCGCGGRVVVKTERGTFTDSRDGKTYRIVKIGDQVWMAENLNFATSSGSWCYDDNSANCDIYGRLYDWATAMDFASSCNTTSCASRIQTNHRGICPAGWRVPTPDDWSKLETAIGGRETAARYLKSKAGWVGCGPKGSENRYRCDDAYGFSALPGGYRWRWPDGSFSNIGLWGNWWTTTESGATDARRRDMYFYYENVYQGGSDKSSAFSVRCVRYD